MNKDFKEALEKEAEKWSLGGNKELEQDLFLHLLQKGAKMMDTYLQKEGGKDLVTGDNNNSIVPCGAPLESSNSIELSNELLTSLGFTLITGGSFENIKMPYFCKDAVLLFFNESRTEHEYNSFLIGYGFNDFSGKYYAARFKWIKSLGELEAIYNPITNKKLIREPLPNKELPTLEPEQGEAVEFAEWITDNQFTRWNNVWKSTKIHYSPDYYTSIELYQLFKNK